METDNFTADANSAEARFDGESLVVRCTGGDVATTLVLAIAEVDGVSPTDLDFVLDDYVDPDALNQVFAGERSVGSSDAAVYLRIDDHDVCVHAGGEVIVTE